MRLLPLLGLLTFAVARQAQAQTREPEEPIELGPPPPPPPGASVIDPEEPVLPEISRAPAPAPPVGAVAPIAPVVPDRPEAPRPATPAPTDRPGAAPKGRDGTGWYGWKILIADGGALVLAATSEPVGMVLGGGAYVLAAPSIHLGHKRGFAALGSLTLRIATPLALNALIGKEPCRSDTCIQPGVIIGATLASLVDVIVLAHDGKKPKAEKKTSTLITPTVAPVGRKGTALVLTGSF